MEEIGRNRSALISVIDTVQFCAVQNLALRGHRDDGKVDPSGNIPVENDDNFRALLRFRLRSGDSALQKHLNEGPKILSIRAKLHRMSC